MDSGRARVRPTRSRNDPLGPDRASTASPFSSASLWIVDLDGVVWLSGEPIGDGRRAVAAAAHPGRAGGLRHQQLRAHHRGASGPPGQRSGSTPSADDLVTSAGAAASLLDPASRCEVLAEGGVLEALAARGVTRRSDGGRADAAVVGWSRSFDFDPWPPRPSAARGRAG